ncbi:MAG: hypothetical protein UX39_C0004G0011 [Candidatus Magasanikbacteria bacterium GW2011_GWA2_46_17]|uniref:Polymerase nucleotidyl transferase domain-containing protein n=1 Tax=Candidatus Magasanikbacteria bacterium GW2011_GWA2_46_17 TaxID=1619042 RepID=A0A0G1RAU7_9BACT|nr:MAG: hypothetical protein UX39_C0004G0011 [Candidatus Magasanikbacteria bacterium GW2011_GWA2_46_17]
MSKGPFEQSVLRTLAYFDIAYYPLTKEELFAFLWQPPAMGYEEFEEKLDKMFGRGELETMWGYYLLAGSEAIIENRRRKIVFTENKLKRAARAAKKIRSVPFIKAIFVCNTVGSEQAAVESDIDFLIITSPRRIWFVRFFTNFILRLWRLRTYGKKNANRVCLSFYLDSDRLNVAPWRVADDDIHFAYWVHQMFPIYDPEDYYAKFLEANNWTKRYLPYAAKSYKPTYRFTVNDSKLGKIWKKIWETMWGSAYGNFIEDQAKAMQWQMLKLSVKEKSKLNDNGVVFADGVIKVHENDTRLGYRERWKEKVVEI